MLLLLQIRQYDFIFAYWFVISKLTLTFRSHPNLLDLHPQFLILSAFCFTVASWSPINLPHNLNLRMITPARNIISLDFEIVS